MSTKDTDSTQYFTPEVLSRAEPIIDDAISKLRRPIQSLTWNELSYPEARQLARELTKRLDVPYAIAPHLVKLVLDRRETRAVLSVFSGERTLEEAAAETRISRSDLAEELEARRPELQRIFGPERQAIRGWDHAMLSFWDQGSAQEKAIAEAAQMVGTTPPVFIAALETFRRQIFDPARDPKTIARQITLLLSRQGEQEHQSEAISIEKVHNVVEGLVRQLSGETTKKKDITEYRITTPGDTSQSAESQSVKPPSRGNSRKQ
jgi:hypothetical protein